MEMADLQWTGAAVLILAGLAGLVLPVLPGAPLLFAGLLLAAWAENFQYVGTWTIVALGTMAGLSYLAEFAASALGARRYGASSRAVMGAAAGGLAGIFLGLPGILLGPFVGAVIGELSLQKSLHEAGKAGFGATLGMILGGAAKIALGIGMIGIYILVRFL
ncbi:MAG: DUF456 domain-containing protein [Desulfuromonadaceae bacterium]|nr:DUF456 domain-containing protein [Desulfuromonadaceae bacterium]